ncbi:hypothetical protein R6Q57_028284 [Mikania cordata]
MVEEGGIPPLLKLLKEDSSEAQIVPTITLLNLANDQDRARLITDELGVSIIVQSLQKSPIRNQGMDMFFVERMRELTY